MDLQFEASGEEYIIPSQAHFGNREIIMHTAWGCVRGERQQFKSIRFNAQYDSKKWLCEKLCQEVYHLSRDLKQRQYTQEQCLIYSTKRILKHIAKHADEQGMYAEHKILHLTFKFVLHLVSKRVASKNMQIDGQTSLHQWLTDVDALLFKPNSQYLSPQGGDNEDELIENLKRKDYEGVLANLQVLGAKQSDQAKKRKIELIIKMLIVKMEDQQVEFSISPRPEQIKMANKLTFQALLKQYQEVFKQEKGKKKNAKQQRDKLQIVGEVLLGSYEAIKFLVKDSWPLFLTHVLSMQPEQALSHEWLTEQVKAFLNLQSKISVLTLSQETQYLLSLMSGKNLHIIYQSLFDLVCPLYSHLIAYFIYYFYEAAPLLVLMQEDYMLDLVRSLLDQSSQVSYLCLFLAFGLVENNELVEKKAEMMEPLLYYHLSVVDIDDHEEVQLFLKKMRALSTLSLQKYGFSHFRMLITSFFQSHRLSEIAVQAYLLYSALYGKIASYEFDMIPLTDRYFTAQTLPPQTIESILKIGQKLKGKKIYRKQFKEFERIYPSFEKFILLNEAREEEDLYRKMDITIRLMKLTMQSLPLTEVIAGIIEAQQQGAAKGGSGECSPEQISLQHQFLIHVRRYLEHYPKVHSCAEGRLIEAIGVMIG